MCGEVIIGASFQAEQLRHIAERSWTGPRDRGSSESFCAAEVLSVCLNFDFSLAETCVQAIFDGKIVGSQAADCISEIRRAIVTEHKQQRNYEGCYRLLDRIGQRILSFCPDLCHLDRAMASYELIPFLVFMTELLETHLNSVSNSALIKSGFLDALVKAISPSHCRSLPLCNVVADLFMHLSVDQVLAFKVRHHRASIVLFCELYSDTFL
jgi:hypothetical protein